MTDQPPYDQPPYSGPPPTEPVDPNVHPTCPGYPSPYGQAPYPGAPYQYPAAQYPAPYPYPYRGGPYVPVAPPRPGTATASAVLGYVTAGLLIIAALIVLTGASIVDDLGGGPTGELIADGLLNLLAAGLLIGGSVGMTSRSTTGRSVHGVGSAIVVCLSIYWIARWDEDLPGRFFWAAVFFLLAVIALVLSWLPEVTRWLAGRR